jgi:hypothetical protein
MLLLLFLLSVFYFLFFLFVLVSLPPYEQGAPPSTAVTRVRRSLYKICVRPTCLLNLLPMCLLVSNFTISFSVCVYSGSRVVVRYSTSYSHPVTKFFRYISSFQFKFTKDFQIYKLSVLVPCETNCCQVAFILLCSWRVSSQGHGFAVSHHRTELSSFPADSFQTALLQP